jgi:extradiol dioxygenase family protein
MAQLAPFHLALPVNNIEEARAFYTVVIGCIEGKSSDARINFDFFGHQLAVHRDPNHRGHNHSNIVDGHSVPIPHFGLVMDWDEWHKQADKFKNDKVRFVVEPYTRFNEDKGEQASMFLLDPSGNALEFKAYKK